jgi:hypothetical protein
MTAIGLIATAIQTFRVRSLEKRNKEQFEIFIEDANYVSFEHEMIDEISEKIKDPVITRFLSSSHQRGCDLYRNLVDFYLSSQKVFTYDDLRQACSTPMITRRWQERFWRGRIAMRSENKKIPVPTELYLKDDQTPRLDSLHARSNSAKTSE